ncbi:hypothetical protein Pmani_029235 [Petrolisthes manimaculis]|uniref:Piwi domain-containing protein n=1 Tax=Petrolisthes manimaculis TaxID=1843537 RepID=A0AAE1P0G0_9EUCA|nr:hypothetical protein Pmani_029235 [Petrolisthes manimaculis]
MTQINTKCGGVPLGINWKDMLPESRVMCEGVLLLGGAVVHPKPNAPNRSGSMGALVADFNGQGMYRRDQQQPPPPTTTQYRVMTNDANLPLEHLETVTNTLCYLHARGTYHDSLPAPARHALLAAECSRAMIEHTKDLDNTCKTVFAVDKATSVDFENPLYASLYYI